GASKTGLSVKRQEKELEMQDACLACLLLKVPSDEVQELADLADTFNRLGLFIARIALLYTCGEKKRLNDEMPDEIKAEGNALEEMVDVLKKQLAFDEAPSKLCREMRSVCTFE